MVILPRSLVLLLGLTSAAGLYADQPPDLPADVAQKVLDFERDASAIQQKADEEIRARRQKLLTELKELQIAATKAGDLDKAVAIRDYVAAMTEEAVGANLLVNGGFEEGPNVGGFGYSSLKAPSDAIPGWIVSRGQIDYHGSVWKHAEGDRSIDLHGTNAQGAIKQAFATRPGKKYRVTFSLAGNPDGGPPIKGLGMVAAGQTAKFAFDTTGKNRTSDMGWRTETWEFTAKGTRTTLEIGSLMPRPDSWGPGIDNVSVVELVGE